MHVGIFGTTKAGKGTVAKWLIANRFRGTGRPIIVLDPVCDPGYLRAGADFCTDDPDEFFRVVKANPKSVVFADEAKDFRANKIAREMLRRMAAQFRHAGINAHYLSHRYKDVEPAIRTCLDAVYLFASTKKDCEELAEDFLCDELLKGVQLQKGQFIFHEKFGPVLKGDVSSLFGKV